MGLILKCTAEIFFSKSFSLKIQQDNLIKKNKFSLKVYGCTSRAFLSVSFILKIQLGYFSKFHFKVYSRDFHFFSVSFIVKIQQGFLGESFMLSV